jgi:PAS domain S-box-containing protein
MARQPLVFKSTAAEPGPQKPWQRDAFIDASHRIARLGYCEWNYEQGCIISCSTYYAEIFGMTVPEVIDSQSTWEKVLLQLHPDDRADYARSHAEFLGKGRHEIEYRIFRKDGAIRHIKEVGIVFFDEHGNPAESMGLLQDITEQKERIHDLENRDAMVRQVEAVTDIGHFIWDIDSETYRYLSPGYLKISGADESLLHPRANSLAGYIDEIHADDRTRIDDKYRWQRETSADLTTEYRLSNPEGGYRWIRETSIIRQDKTSGKSQAIGILQDITEQKIYEQSLLDAKLNLETEVDERTKQLSETVDRLNREISEREIISSELGNKNAELERFTYTVSHDLKSPLVTIKGFLGLLEQDIESNDRKRIVDDIEKLKNATDTMGALLSDLLELSRVGKVIGEARPCSLSTIATQAIELVRPALDQRGIEMTIDELPQVQGDEARLVEALMNLVENAIKFMGTQESPSIRISADSRDGMVYCSVRDNGIGIAPGYHDKIFELFERLDAGIEGTGVGLALVKRIIENHGGEIWVESDGPGQGVAMHFTLPAV